jgi:hypothetical protein
MSLIPGRAPGAAVFVWLRRLMALALGLVGLIAVSAAAADAPRVHGLWVWKGPSILSAPQGAQRLREFCREQGVGEIYISALDHGKLSDAAELASLIALLHHTGVRVEALLSSTDADEAGKHRDKLLEHVRLISRFNASHPGSRFDGIHLDIEPQQRPENKGAGNLRFLPGLVDAYRAVRALSEPAGLTVNADIQNKLLKGSLEERRLLLGSLPRLTLMLYELNDDAGGGGASSADTQKAQVLRAASAKFLTMAYQGLPEAGVASMVIALRTPDYGAELPQMLKVLDEANVDNPHYAGWARHSYNDVLKDAP